MQLESRNAALTKAGAEGLLQKRHELQQQKQRLEAEARLDTFYSSVFTTPFIFSGPEDASLARFTGSTILAKNKFQSSFSRFCRQRTCDEHVLETSGLRFMRSQQAVS